VNVLFIGGTGNISASVSRLCVEKGIDLYLLNRGLSRISIPGTELIVGNISHKKNVQEILKNHEWDVVANWIAFTEDDVVRDFNLFKGKTKQYIFISSASAYQTQLGNPIISESTPLENPYWQYSRDKITCEKRLNKFHENENFPVTIVRPSHTYDTVIPVPIGGWNEYTIIDRIKKGKKIIVHGDGTSLWTITHANDFAKGFIGLLNNTNAIGETYHITSDEILTWDQIYNSVANATGIKPNIVHIASDLICSIEKSLTGTLLGDKSVSAIFDNSKIKSIVPNFKATIPFARGIKETIKWFESESKRMVINNQTDNMMDRIISEYENS
jgi:nucleoside-diphosphate-sugar epimerase